MVDTLDPDIAWDEYKFLEEDFVEYLRYVPLTNEHKDVWSLYLGDLLLRIGSILDSFFRRAIYSPVLDNANSISRYRALDDFQINMGIYRELYNPFYNLSSKKIYELRTFEQLTPFLSWSSDDSPCWWKNYNHVKHDRFKNKKEAKLKSVLEALSGLFILNVIHLETMPVLVDYDIIHSGLAKGYLKSVLSNREPLEVIENIYAKSKLFGYVFELSSEYEPDFKQILSRSYPGY
jgi:hypothetical protein